jgi:hypothetical protein
VIPLAINNVSAFSKTQPGGYADDHPELEQFALTMTAARKRSPARWRPGSAAGMERLGQLAGTRFAIVMITNFLKRSSHDRNKRNGIVVPFSILPCQQRTLTRANILLPPFRPAPPLCGNGNSINIEY